MPQLVAVFWDDAHGSITVDVDSDDLGGLHAPVKMITLGWLLRWDSNGISVASERDDGGGWRGHTFVPAGCIWGVRSPTARPEHAWETVEIGAGNDDD